MTEYPPPHHRYHVLYLLYAYRVVSEMLTFDKVGREDARPEKTYRHKRFTTVMHV